MARIRGTFTNRDGNWQAQHPAIFYFRNLLPSILLFLMVQTGFAAGFMLVEGFDFGTALYHCLVTASTVGYGNP